MEQHILDYIKTQMVGVLAVEMLDGSPHAATVHFAHTEDPLSFIFLTDRTSRKAEPVIKNGHARASFVVGTNPENMKTFQLDGTLQLTDNQADKDAYFAKFPDKKEKVTEPDDIFLKFEPTWWRFTDWTTPEGKKIWTSS